MEGCGVSAGPGPDAMEGCGVSAGPGPDAMEGCRVSAGPGPSADAMERCGVSAGPGADATERSGVSPGPGPGPGAGGRTYFCTAGGGLEDLLAEELHTRLGAEDVCHVSGKVLFRTSAGMDALRRLKSAERLFLLVSREAPVALPAHTCPVKAASLLQASLLGDGSQWADAAVTWSRLQGETESWGSDMQQAAGAPRQQRKTDASGEEGRRGREEGCDGGVRRRGGEVSADGRRRECEGEEGSDGVNEEQKCGKKRKRVGDELDGGGGQGEGMERQMEQLTSPPPPPPPGVPSPPQRVTFRVNCKLSGPLSRCLTSQDLGRVIGSGLCRLMGWKVELRSPQLEVNVYLSGDHSILGIPLTRLPLASRSYMRSTGLRSTVAWALGSLASIQPGWCVLDPMCGVGTILLEAAQEHKDVHFLGVDIDDGQLQRANENVTFADLRDRIHLMKASCSGLPVSSSSVDAVVCDVPFGRKFNTKTNMADSLRCIVSEMERVLRPGGSLVLLLSPPMSCQLKKLQAPPGPSTQPPQEPHPQAPPGPSTQPPQEPHPQAPPGPSTQPPQEPHPQAPPGPSTQPPQEPRLQAPPGPSTQPPQEPQLQAPPGPSTQPPQEPQLQAPPGPSTQPPQEPRLQAPPGPSTQPPQEPQLQALPGPSTQPPQEPHPRHPLAPAPSLPRNHSSRHPLAPARSLPRNHSSRHPLAPARSLPRNHSSRLGHSLPRLPLSLPSSSSLHTE